MWLLSRQDKVVIGSGASTLNKPGPHSLIHASLLPTRKKRVVPTMMHVTLSPRLFDSGKMRLGDNVDANFYLPPRQRCCFWRGNTSA